MKLSDAFFVSATILHDIMTKYDKLYSKSVSEKLRSEYLDNLITRVICSRLSLYGGMTWHFKTYRTISCDR